MQEVHILEAVVGVILLLSALAGYRKGLIRTLYSMISIIITFIATLFLVYFVRLFMPETVYFRTELSYIISFICACILVSIIDNALGLINYLPVVKHVNKFAGLLAGILKGLIFTWFLFFCIFLFQKVEFCSQLIGYIHQSNILSSLYDSNPASELVKFVFSFFNNQDFNELTKSKFI